MKPASVLVIFVMISCALSAKMITEDLGDKEAAVAMMINAERTQRKFEVPLFLSPSLVLAARGLASGTFCLF